MRIATSPCKFLTYGRSPACSWLPAYGFFQADFQGGERDVQSADESLDFGVGTLFVRDPDGNLIEFLQLGHGLFTAEMQPQVSA